MTPRRANTPVPSRTSTHATHAGARRATPSAPFERQVPLWTGADDRPLPLVLRQRADHTMRWHAMRSVLRIGSLVLGDLAMLVLAHACLRAIGDARWFGDTAGDVARALVPAYTFTPVEVYAGVLVGLLVFGTYGQGDRRRDPTTILFGVASGFALNWWHVLWTRPSALLVAGFAVATLATWILVLVARLVVDRGVRRLRPHALWAERVLVVGAAEHARRVLKSPLCDGGEVNAIGFLDANPVVAADALGSIGEFARIIREQEADTVIIAGGLTEDAILRLVHTADAAGCQVYTVPAYFNAPGIEPTVQWRRGSALVQITRPGTQSQQLIVKRVFDVAVAGTMLLLLAPLLVLIAVGVKATSKGPVFFRQARIGRGGRRFEIWKFRSMVVDAEARLAEVAQLSVYEDGRLFKVKDDPRVTRFGAFLRRTSLDELPQLWNVLRGDMSLVGPRPPVPSEVELYAEHHYTRFDVRPGLTGPWQVSGRNNITSFEQVIELETAYIRHWTLWKDFSILAQTIPSVVKMDGAH